MIAKTHHYLKDNPKQLISLYYSIFACHILYGCQIWGLNNNRYTDKIQTAQNRAIRLIAFSDTEPHLHTIEHYKNLKILKLCDIVTLKNLLFAHDYLNKKLPACFDGYFILDKDLYPQTTRSSSANKLFIPITEQVRYGDHSFKSRVISAWNNLCDSFPNKNLISLSHKSFKNLVTSYFLDGYTHDGP